MHKINKYFVAGAIATVPMTIMMMKLFKKLPREEKYPLPPRVITMNLAQEAGVKKYLNEDEKVILTFINHFGYGAAAGAVYYPLAKKIPVDPLISGPLYGVCVWGFSYLGLLPALNLYPSAKREPKERNAMMILSHVVWGASLGLINKIYR